LPKNQADWPALLEKKVIIMPFSNDINSLEMALPTIKEFGI
jgi:hypothetical protein